MRAFFVVLLVCCACSASHATVVPTTTTIPTHIINGTVELTGTSSMIDPNNCNGIEGFSDITEGAVITVRDGANQVIGTGNLLLGVQNAQGCNFSFTVEVPDTSFYQFAITHRSAPNYSRSDLASMGWTVNFTLG